MRKCPIAHRPIPPGSLGQLQEFHTLGREANQSQLSYTRNLRRIAWPPKILRRDPEEW
jgi:hypothetical protein